MNKAIAVYSEKETLASENITLSLGSI